MTAGHGRPEGEGGARVSASPSPFGLGSAGLVRRHIWWRLGEPTRRSEPLFDSANKKAPVWGPFIGGADGARTRDFQRDRLAL